MRRNKAIGIVAVMCLMVCANALALEIREVDITADAKVASANVWRGQVLNEDAVIQPSVTLESGGEIHQISLNIWGTWDLEHTEDSSSRTRMDGTLAYEYKEDPSTVSAGVVAYIYQDSPGGDSRDTFELFAGYALDVALLPAVTVYYDFEDIEGFYGTLTLKHGFEIVEDVAHIDIKGCLGAGDKTYNQEVFTIDADEDNGIEGYEPDKATLTDWSAEVLLPVAMGETYEITPAVKYMSLLDSDIRNAQDDAGNHVDQFVYSLTLSAYF